MSDVAAIDAVVARSPRHNRVTFQKLESEVGVPSAAGPVAEADVPGSVSRASK